jgi:coenzyme F420-0:L-glutamate ligase/coenzyme F420-1:gamma-L-glutamate ligase
MPTDPLLSSSQLAFLEASRRAVLGTIAPDGQPRLVPICFVLVGESPILYTPIDDKPKRNDDPLALARVRDIQADPRVTVLLDRWDEDWTRLAWLRVEGRAQLLDAAVGSEHANGIGALRAKYPQYEMHRLEHRPLIRVTLERVSDWGLRQD